jgi:hypothetical protein
LSTSKARNYKENTASCISNLKKRTGYFSRFDDQDISKTNHADNTNYVP